ncbi:MAG: hypothetical protein HC806_01055 [Anaerolineae bacterium]|nr:hypothetical protein [Anaerolineae bacterium]
MYVRLAIFDRQLWYDTSAQIQELTDWDSAALYLNLTGNLGDEISSNSFAFVGQLNNNEPNLEMSYQGNGGQWQQTTIPFTSTAGWQSEGGLNNDSIQDRGWTLTYSIPFTSLGLSNAPPSNSVWGLGVLLYDRDDMGEIFKYQKKPGPPQCQLPFQIPGDKSPLGNLSTHPAF